jgi:adenylyltransferase/sulfurtransferase
VGRSKLESAKDRLRDLNPHVEIDTYETTVSSENALELFKPYDVILDGTDNFPTRYLVNDACVIAGKAERVRQHLPVRRAGVGVRYQRRVRAIAAFIRAARRQGLCRAAPEGGVLGVLPGIIGVIQGHGSNQADSRSR